MAEKESMTSMYAHESLQVDDGATDAGTNKKGSRKRVKLIITIIVFICIIIAIIIGISVASKKKYSIIGVSDAPVAPTDAPTNAPTYESPSTVDTIDLKSGETRNLSSPGYPAPYPDSSEQYWLLRAPDGHRIRIEFIDMRTEVSYDKVRVGSSHQVGGEFIASFSGYDLPPTMTSSGNALWVQLLTDYATAESGFLASITVLSEDEASFECPDGSMPCKYVQDCFSEARRCDGSYTCPSGQDEIGCKCANPFNFKCSDGRCVDRANVCDYVTDCSDDEAQCGFQCDNSYYLSHAFRCDNTNDCGDYSDEKDCDCIGVRWQCPDGTCIYRHNVCDGFPHCSGGEDERDCDCQSWQFQCANTGDCIPYWERCDGHNTCGDNSDEVDCPVCPDKLYQCASFQCLDMDKVCNGAKDCFGGDDEVDCEEDIITTCPNDEFWCAGKCLRQSLVCDGVEQCRDGEEEENCTTENPDQESCNGFECPTTSANVTVSCLPLEARCNGSSECPDGDDEADCALETPTPPSCADDQVMCSSDGSCIPYWKWCNEIIDCPRGEEEENCTFGGWLSCVHFSRDAYFVCDGKEDCAEGIDEADCTCGTRPALSYLIFGGKGTKLRGTWPWQVMFSASNSTRGVTCGGSIIGRDWVFTAAHCVSSQSVGSTFVLAGVTDRKDIHDGIQYREIAKVFRHPNASAGGYDIALVKVSEPFIYTALVQPVCLPEANITIEGGEYVTVTGWGDTGSGLNPIQLMEARLPFLPPEVCDRWSYWSLEILQERIMCAGYEQGITTGCHGDSGGPLVIQRDGRWTLVGAVSGGNTCGTAYTPNLYTRVSPNLEWIEDTMRAN